MWEKDRGGAARARERLGGAEGALPQPRDVRKRRGLHAAGVNAMRGKKVDLDLDLDLPYLHAK